MAQEIVERLRELCDVPERDDEFATWLQAQDAITFLQANGFGDDFVLYAGGRFVFMHAVLIPNSVLGSANKEELSSWNFNASRSWSVLTSGVESTTHLEEPLHDERNRVYSKGEQIVFARFFEGHLSNKSYFEILQKFVHVLDLHFVEERKAYCRLDRFGDIEEVVRFVETEGNKGHSGISAVLCKGRFLAQYAALTESAVVRTFDFTRYRLSGFGGWSKIDRKEVGEGDLFYELGVDEQKHASFARGVQVLRTTLKKDEVARRMYRDDDEERKYASFLAQDWKNKCVIEISCHPNATSNYFTKSDLPFEISPAFFRPEVLTRYKADSERYTMRDRSITCRGTWSLKSYDINEAGQVHAYICDLEHLPYEEQMHWKAYNEAPKSGISKRAFLNDFEGQWDTEPDPLVGLRSSLARWGDQSVPWWTLRDGKLPERIHYPVTTSPDEWANELLNLQQLVVEGFEEIWLREKAKSLGRSPDVRGRSLKLLEECLIGIGFEESHAHDLVAPLQRLNLLRVKIKGHASGSEAVQLKKQAIKDFGSYKAHFRNLCRDVETALLKITEAFEDKRMM